MQGFSRDQHKYRVGLRGACVRTWLGVCLGNAIKPPHLKFSNGHRFIKTTAIFTTLLPMKCPFCTT